MAGPMDATRAGRRGRSPGGGARIGILGAGRIGAGLATLLARAGHEVTVGVRSTAPTLPADVAGAVRTGPLASVHRGADAVIVALPHTAAHELLPVLAPELRGVPVIDAANAARVEGGRFLSALPDGLTHGTWTARLLPGAIVVRAFSHIQDELLVSRASRQPGLWAVACAADPGADAADALGIVRSTGYVPVVVSDLAGSAVLDPGGALFPRMYTVPELEGLGQEAAA